MKTTSSFLLSVAAALQLQVLAAESIPYTAHEWGTFTSVQGTDGAVIDWNPFTVWELPDFVYTRQRPLRGADSTAPARAFASLDLKQGAEWRQRMETPVIYFHAPRAFDVNVRVRFPQGLVTEWYPATTAFGPVAGASPVLADSSESFAAWEGLRVLAPGSQPGRPVIHEAGASHYYAARETAANLVQATRRLNLTPSDPPETEHFIFYRGAGNFDAPVRVRTPDDRSIGIQNLGAHVIRGLVVVHVRDGRAGFATASPLSPGEPRTLPVPELQERNGRYLEELSRTVRRALETEGLFADEAQAMVKTWGDSWFSEPGLRLFYVLPRPDVDAILPLTLDPPPHNLVRVFVGRAELIAPRIERELMEVFQARPWMPTDDILRRLHALALGRFTEAGLQRAAKLEQERVAEVQSLLPTDTDQPDQLERETQAIRQRLGELRRAYLAYGAARETSRQAPGGQP